MVQNHHHEEWGGPFYALHPINIFSMVKLQAAQTYWGTTPGLQPEAAANTGPMYAVSTVAKGVLSILTERHLSLKATS